MDSNENNAQLNQIDISKPYGSTSSTGVESGTGNVSEALGPTPPVVSMVSKHSNGKNKILADNN